MMKRILSTAFAAASVILLSACKEIIDFNGKYDGEKLVLFSCANPDASRLTVSLSKSRFFLDDSQDPNPFDLKGGTVTMTIGDKTVTLTEDPDRAGTFHTDLVPDVGGRVVLNASAPGLAPVTCEAVVPERVRCEVEHVDTKVLGESDWTVTVEHHVRITIHDDGSRRDYYRFSAVRTETGPDIVLYASTSLLTNDVAFVSPGAISSPAEIIDSGEKICNIDGVYDDSFFNGKDYSFEVWFEDSVWKYAQSYGGHSEEPVDYDIHDLSGWGIEVDALSEDLYKYLRSREDYIKSDEGLISFFTEPVGIHSNIMGGIGCFGAITPALTMF